MEANILIPRERQRLKQKRENNQTRGIGDKGLWKKPMSQLHFPKWLNQYNYFQDFSSIHPTDNKTWKHCELWQIFNALKVFTNQIFNETFQSIVLAAKEKQQIPRTKEYFSYNKFMHKILRRQPIYTDIFS